MHHSLVAVNGCCIDYLFFRLQYYQLKGICEEQMTHLTITTTQFILTALLILLIKAETINIDPTYTYNPSIIPTNDITYQQTQQINSTESSTPIVDEGNIDSNGTKGEPVNGTDNFGEVYQDYANITLLQLINAPTDTEEIITDIKNSSNSSQPYNQSINQSANAFAGIETSKDGNNSMMGDQQLQNLVNQLANLQYKTVNQGLDAVPFQYTYNLSQEPSNPTTPTSSCTSQERAPTPHVDNPTSPSNQLILDSMKTTIDAKFLALFRG